MRQQIFTSQPLKNWVHIFAGAIHFRKFAYSVCILFCSAAALYGQQLSTIPSDLQVQVIPGNGEIRIADLWKDTAYSMRHYIKKGEQEFHEGRYREAVQYYYLALPFCGDTTNIKCVVSCHNHIGAAYTSAGAYGQALWHFYRSIRMLEEHGLRESLYMTDGLCNIASVYSAMREDSMAFHYMKEAKKIILRNKWYAELPTIYMNTGTNLARAGIFDSAAYYLEQAIVWDEKMSRTRKDYRNAPAHKDLPSRAYSNLGLLYLNQNNYAAARNNFEKAIALSTAHSTKIYPTVMLSTVHAAAGHFPAAEKVMLEALRQAQEEKIRTHLELIYEQLSFMYEQHEDYKKALQYEKLFRDLKDSMAGTEMKTRTRTLEVQYRTAEKDRQLAEEKLAVSLRDQTIRRKNLWLTGISSGIVLMGLLLAGSIRSYRQRQKLQTQKLIAIEQTRKVEQLQAKIEGEEIERGRIAAVLHDGVGSMISASRMNLSTLPVDEAHRETYQRIALLLNDAAAEIRNTAHNLMPSMLLQEGLSQAIASFCERVQNGKTLTIDYQFMGKETPLSAELELFVYRLVQELINNTLKHAGASEILVQLSIRPDMLTISVEDNGKGMDTEKATKGTGLRNLHEKTEIMGGHLTVESAPGKGTQVYAEFDLSFNQSSEMSR